MFNNLNKYSKYVLLSEEEFDEMCIEQTKYLMSIYSKKRFISQRDLKKSYKILEKYHCNTYKNRVKKFTNKTAIIDNIEEIVRLRKLSLSHQKIADVMPLSKATIQKYLRLLGIDNG